MNRPGVGPQSLRGLPSGFPNQQQIPQNRSFSSRLPPTGKMAGNSSTWAFGGGLPMGNTGLQRPNNASLTSFAQTIGSSSQPATPLDMSEFPSLSNNQPQPSQSTWAGAGARFAPSANIRMQQSNVSSQQQLSAQQQTQQQQDDLFSQSSQLPSSQSSFRFGNQNAVGQASQPSNNDEFPPLNRNANGEIGQDRTSNPGQTFAFGGQSNGLGSANASQSNRSNGLLNAIIDARGTSTIGTQIRMPSPASQSGVSTTRSPIDTGHHALNTDNETNAFANAPFGSSNPLQAREINTTQSVMGVGSRGRPEAESFPQAPDQAARSQTFDSGVGSSQGHADGQGAEPEDPLAHMSEIDKWGLKGFSFMMNNFPDYASLVAGQDLSTLGFDLNSSEPISTQIYSLWDNEPPRPAIAPFNLPECYRVHNIAQLESKMTNFNDEALIFMFYSNPGDIQQVMAAQELHNRNWRYHKKLQLWLTKDDMMVPQSLGNGTERGYYIFFDIKQWRRERREFTLIYDDLENLPSRAPMI